MDEMFEIRVNGEWRQYVSGVEVGQAMMDMTLDLAVQYNRVSPVLIIFPTKSRYEIQQKNDADEWETVVTIEKVVVE